MHFIFYKVVSRDYALDNNDIIIINNGLDAFDNYLSYIILLDIESLFAF